MSFRDNLQYLRGTRDLSQAQLATLLGVSRQSVAKWEAEKSYPEMDKLIKLCDLFECSLDDLVRGDLTRCDAADEELATKLAMVEALAPVVEELPLEAVGIEAEAVEVKVTDTSGYDEHMRRRAWDVAAGVAAIVMSFGVNFFIVGGYGSMTASVSIVIHLIGIAVGLCFFIPAYRGHVAFRKEHPHVQDFYTLEEKVQARSWEALGIVASIALVVLGFFVPGMLATFQIYNQFPSLVLFACFAAAAALFIYSIMLNRRVDVSFYNSAPDFTIQSLLRGRRTDV